MKSPNPPAPFPPREGGVRVRKSFAPPSLGGKGAGGLGLLLLFLLLPTRAADNPPRIPASSAQAFQLGYALGLPGASARVFVENVKSLKGLDDEDAGPRIKILARQAGELRQTEARAMTAAADLLKAMGAPTVVRDGPDGIVKTLAAPLILSKEQRALAKTDSDTAQILATMDEAEAVKKEADSTVAALAGWLKLTRGSDAVWSADVGTLTTQVFVARQSPGRPQFALSAATLLARRAPPFTPPAVKDALESLAPRGGNLAELASPNAVKLPPLVVQKASDALLSAFRATRLLDAPAK